MTKIKTFAGDTNERKRFDAKSIVQSNMLFRWVDRLQSGNWMGCVSCSSLSLFLSIYQLNIQFFFYSWLIEIWLRNLIFFFLLFFSLSCDVVSLTQEGYSQKEPNGVDACTHATYKKHTHTAHFKLKALFLLSIMCHLNKSLHDRLAIPIENMSTAWQLPCFGSMLRSSYSKFSCILHSRFTDLTSCL